MKSFRVIDAGDECIGHVASSPNGHEAVIHDNYLNGRPGMECLGVFEDIGDAAKKVLDEGANGGTYVLTWQ